jgi:hypothetical protein
MSLRVIEIDPADTFHSVRDRLLQGERGRTVLALAAKTAPLSGIDLVLLRRLADRERLEVGLVTADKDLARQARALGLPAFSSTALAEYYRPGWWRARRRPERVGFAPWQDRRSPARAAAEAQSDPIAAQSRRARRMALILLTILALALLAGAALYALPRATLTLRPETPPGQVIVDLTADPGLAEIAGLALPARAVQHEMAWEASGPSTGDDDADWQRIRALALQSLHAAAPQQLATRLNTGELLVPDSVGIEVVEENLTGSGETAVLTLSVAATGLAVAEAHVRQAALGELVEALPAGFAPDPASLRVAVEPAAGGPADRVRVTALATGRPAIDPAGLAETLRGQPLAEAQRYLEDELPVESFTLDVWPAWWAERFGRLPWRAGRIAVKLLP